MFATQQKLRKQVAAIPARFVRTQCHDGTASAGGRAFPYVKIAKFRLVESEPEGYDPYDHAPQIPDAE